MTDSGPRSALSTFDRPSRFVVHPVRVGPLRSRSFPAQAVAIRPAKPALAAAFDKGSAERVMRLHRRDDLPEDKGWLRAPGWCPAYC
jgi:hypothetical protein